MTNNCFGPCLNLYSKGSSSSRVQVQCNVCSCGLIRLIVMGNMYTLSETEPWAVWGGSLNEGAAFGWSSSTS